MRCNLLLEYDGNELGWHARAKCGIYAEWLVGHDPLDARGEGF